MRFMKTPARGAATSTYLASSPDVEAITGQYFANKAPSQTVDPVQYSCQKNFTILSTDGYWNTGNETSSYGPYGLDGKNVGQQDGDFATRGEELGDFQHGHEVAAVRLAGGGGAPVNLEGAFILV